MENVISTTLLTKKYHDYAAVNKVSLHVRKGEIYGFIGKNGAGKTTFMKMICGLASPTDGEIELFGKNGSQLAEIRERIGNLIEIPGLYPGMTAYQNLNCKCIAMGIHKKGYIQEILELVGLKDVGKKKVKNFSLGMKQRLGIAMAITGEPDLLILDEPINGLDPQGIMEVRETIKRLNREKNMTIMISSHILEELYRLADTFGIIDKGSLIQEVTKEELEEKCSDYIKIKSGETERVCTVLESMDISEYKIIDKNTIYVYEKLDMISVINMELCKKECRIESIHVVKENLENYFINITTGGQKND
ncbi:MAG: ATP-binding cassette domain-containing protein [Lachnospiraceae bacterium]|nr:ATP-binding cassette domain-containing protein [Lachnospiraceae bacterium]